jgi:hypothetical protein
MTLSMAQLHRESPSALFFLWAGVCEWVGYALVAALLGWWIRRTRLDVRVLRIPDRRPWTQLWFLQSQAILAAACVPLIIWVSIDFVFEGMGEDVALFGLQGRMCSSPAALMLVGTSILMAWQTRGRWRAGWQYAAMASGVLFTSSVSWASLDAAAFMATGDAAWPSFSFRLMLSASMMTLMAGVGLAQVLPRTNDWILRGRRAVPAFGGLALLMLAVVLMHKFCV